MSQGSFDLVRRVRETGVDDPRVLEAIAAVPREGFVPPGRVDRASHDAPVPIPHGQVTTQPSLSARMIAGLGLKGDERVLEIGTGYGWQTALLARLAGEVVSVERHRDLAEAARRNLAAAGEDGRLRPRRSLTGACFVRLVGEHGFPAGEEDVEGRR